jgi:two-component system, OmpR family, sensor histidine kinase BaeS
VRRLLNGIQARIALAALLVAILAMGVLVVGVFLVGGQTFKDLMMGLGVDVSHSESMFQDSVGRVLLVSAVIAVVLSVLLATLIGRRVARPLRDAGDAARRIAQGDYASRMPRQGPDEIATLADSFNQMAVSLQEQRRIRDQFIADAAHELRTPLTNLQGYLEAMRDGVVVAEPATFESLLEETERLVRLSRSLDTLAEGDAGRPIRAVSIDLAALVSSAVELVEPQMRSRGIRMDLRLPGTLTVQADPDALLQVMGNLLQNAARYTPTDGQVAVWIDHASDPSTATVSVSNTGPGIPPEDLPHVFERFYRVDKSRSTGGGGAGIGLAIVRMLVEASGGTVGAASGNGLTRFWFTLPA